MQERPLVSFLLIAYKQERFIREAVQSALAQTYQPLEVVLSDDCSPDRTFEIMKEEAEAYRGPHRVILNQNEKNMGLAENLNRAVQLSHGEFIVIQAGDDVSLPQRTNELFKAWQEPTRVDCVYSDVAKIDADGATLEESVLGLRPPCFPESIERVVKKGICVIWGCSAAYSRGVFVKYGPLDSKILAEDHVLPFRALLGHGIRYCEQVLLKYRLHGNNMTCDVTLKCARSRQEAKRWAINRAVAATEYVRAWDRSGRPRDACRTRLVSLERQRIYDAVAFDVPRLMVPLLAIRGLAQGLSLRHAAGLLRRHFFSVVRS